MAINEWKPAITYFVFNYVNARIEIRAVDTSNVINANDSTFVFDSLEFSECI